MYDVKPITSQKEMDCGATCLQMLLDYYDIDCELDTLIKECNTNISGCTAGDIKRAGNKNGLDMIAYQMCADELIRQDRPAIIWWKKNHFCVFCGIDENDNAVICNPDIGRYRVPLGFFSMFYTGIALFNGEPITLSNVTRYERLGDVENVAGMAYVNSEITLALMEVL